VKASDLPICPKCGWYDGHTHTSECDPKRGATADAFIAALDKEAPWIRATKLGYGYGRVTAVIRKHKCSITLECRAGGSIYTEGCHGLFWLEQLDVETAVKLVCAVDAIDDHLVEQKRRARRERRARG